MNYLALTLPGGQSLAPPKGIAADTGGIAAVSKIIGNALTILLIAAVILTLVYLLLGGLAWIQSGGDKQKVAQARSRLTYAIVGLVVALASFLIINVIGFVFHVNLLPIG